MNIDESSSIAISKLRSNNNTQRKIVNIIFKKRSSRNKIISKSKSLLKKGCYSLPKIKYLPIGIEGGTSTLINFKNNKKQASFYKSGNISVSSIIADSSHTNTSNFIQKSVSISPTKINLRKNKRQINVFENYKNMNNNKYTKIDKKEEEQTKSTIIPNLDISKLTYKTDITSIRNKFSVLFSKEFNIFDKFIQILSNLSFEEDIKSNFIHLHNNSLSCIQYLANTFIDQDIEQFKINEKNLSLILHNLLNFFSYNNKINQNLMKHIHKLTTEVNDEKEKEKETIKNTLKEDDNTKIIDLKKKILSKDETIKKIKKEKFTQYNNFMINMYKLRDEKKDLVKLLLLNKNYFNKYQESQKEIKEKKDIISQNNIDFKLFMKKALSEKEELTEAIKELQRNNKTLNEENKIMKEKINDLENKQIMFDEIIKNKNNIINRLKENLIMKDEELLKYLYDLDKIKNLNEELSYNYISLKKRYKYFTDNENKIIKGNYDEKV